MKKTLALALSLAATLGVAGTCLGGSLTLLRVGRFFVPATPTQFGFNTPLSAPALASGMDTFAPPAQGSSSGAAVAEWTRSADAGNALVVAGPSFSATPSNDKFTFWWQTSSSNAQSPTATPQVADTVAATVITPSFPSWSMFLAWPSSTLAGSGALGLPVGVNRTDAWWVGPNPSTIVAGDSVTIYGRNLDYANANLGGGSLPVKSFVYIETEAGSVCSGCGYVVPTTVTPYAVTFTMPAVAAGNYRLWINNGHGGNFNWSEPAETASGVADIIVVSASPWAGQSSNVVNATCVNAGTDEATVSSAMAGATPPATINLLGGVCDFTSPLVWANNGLALSGVLKNVAAAGTWTTSSTTITTGTNPGGVVAGMSVYDLTSHRPVGVVSTYSGTSLVLAAAAKFASSGSTDALQFTTTVIAGSGGAGWSGSQMFNMVVFGTGVSNTQIMNLTVNATANLNGGLLGEGHGGSNIKITSVNWDWHGNTAVPDNDFNFANGGVSGGGPVNVQFGGPGCSFTGGNSNMSGPSYITIDGCTFTSDGF